MLVRRFTRSELLVHWTLALTVLAMILTGIALGVNIWHAAAFPIHVGSVFVLAAGLLLVAAAGDRGAVMRTGRDLRTFRPGDGRWLAQAPRIALRGGEGPPAGRFNAGQKLNTLLVATLLLASTASGLYWWAKLHGVFANSNLDGAIHNVAG